MQCGQINYKNNGFCLLTNIIPVKKINKIKKDIELIFRTATNDNKTNLDKLIIKIFKNDFELFHNCAKLSHNLISLNKLCNSKLIINNIKKLGLKFPTICSKPIILYSSKHVSKSQVHWQVPAHQDWPSNQGSLNGITVWIPLEKITNSIGPLEICPESHKIGYLEHELNETYEIKNHHDFKFKKIKMNIGDVLIFNNFTIHRSGINTTNKIRFSINFRYNDLLEETFIKRKYPTLYNYTRENKILYPNFPSSNEIKNIFN